MTERQRGDSFPRTAKEMHLSFVGGVATPLEAVRLSIDRIDLLNPALNCFITRLTESALGDADASTRRFALGASRGLIDGIPMAVKDIIYISGVRCTAGSRILGDNVAGYDSPVVAKSKAAGAIIIGTTNLHEFAAGVTSENPHYGPVLNPWDPKRVAGGSSGGSAAAVAAGMVPVALGTDTAGSVRIPAALCGVLGFKPTYGRVSRIGVVPLAPSLDTVGIISSTTWDAAALLQTIAGHGEGDPTTVEVPVPDYPAELQRRPGSPKVGVLSSKGIGPLDPGVREVFASFVARLEELGWGVTELDLGGWEEASRNWIPIRRAEATAFHLGWLEATPELYGDDVRRLLERGKEVRAVDYVNAVNSRPSLMQRFATSLADVDFVALPTTRIAAPTLGEGAVTVEGERLDVYSALNGLTLPFNMVGFPAVSVPAGQARGLPVGAQLAGKPFEEAALLSAVYAYEAKFGPFPCAPTMKRVNIGKDEADRKAGN